MRILRAPNRQCTGREKKKETNRQNRSGNLREKRKEKEEEKS